MALDFDGGGDSQYMLTTGINGLPTGGTPLTMAGFFTSENVTGEDVLAALADSGGGIHHQRLGLGGSVAGDPVRAYTQASGSASADSTSGYTVGPWYHGAARFNAANNRSAWIDGGSGATNTTSRTPSGLDRLGISTNGTSGLGSYMDGKAAEVGFWSSGLASGQVVILAAGFSPLFVGLDTLEEYADLIRDTDGAGGFRGRMGLFFTGYGSVGTPTAAPHPRVYHPANPIVVVKETAAAPPSGVTGPLAATGAGI